MSPPRRSHRRWLWLMLPLAALAWCVRPATPPIDAPAHPPTATAPKPRPTPLPASPRPTGERFPPPEPVSPIAPQPGRGQLTVLPRRDDGTPEPDARIRVQGCGAARLPGPTDGPAVYEVDGGEPCVVSGIRFDGLLAARVGPVEVAVAAGAAQTLTLRFPTARTGGIGVTIAPGDDGVRVVRVIPGGPADRAGLQEGDVIVAVEGTSTAGMSADDFITRMTGPEDTPVQFTLATLGDTGLIEEVVEAVRSFVDRPAP